MAHHVDDGEVESDSSRVDVAMETEDAVAVETTAMRRHDSLKAKKRAVLAALAERRQQTVSDLATDNQRSVDFHEIIVS